MASGKYGSQDLAQYNAWEQLEIFRTRLKIESSPQKEENEPQKQNDSGEIFTLGQKSTFYPEITIEIVNFVKNVNLKM